MQTTRTEHEARIMTGHLARVCGQLNKAFATLKAIEEYAADGNLTAIRQTIARWKAQADFSWNTDD